MTFGEKIKIARKKKKITKEALAKAIGVSLKTMYNYEADQTFPRTRDGYVKIAEALDLNVNDLTIGTTNGAELEVAEMKSNIEALFTRGSLKEDDMDELMLAMQEAYTIAKKKARKERERKEKSVQ